MVTKTSPWKASLTIERKDRELTVSKSIGIDAAHYLPGYEGKCANMHGHHWKIEVAIKGPVDKKTGMVVDFKWLKDALESICGKFDHEVLNKTIVNPTAENIAVYIEEEFLNEWIQGPQETIKIAWIKVWETEDSYALLT